MIKVESTKLLNVKILFAVFCSIVCFELSGAIVNSNKQNTFFFSVENETFFFFFLAHFKHNQTLHNAQRSSISCNFVCNCQFLSNNLSFCFSFQFIIIYIQSEIKTSHAKRPTKMGFLLRHTMKCCSCGLLNSVMIVTSLQNRKRRQNQTTEDQK